MQKKRYRESDKVIVGVLVVAVFLRILHSVPIDGSLLVSSDFSVHLFRVWYFSEYGFEWWNKFWYGGYPFLLYYSPLLYFLSGALSWFIGPVLSIKVISDVAYIVSPILAYMFFREIGVNRILSATSVLFFSVFPVYPYYLFKGSFASLFAIPFLLLGWKYALRYSTTGSISSLLISSVFISLGFLSHAFTAAVFTASVVLFLLVEKQMLPRIWKVLILSSIIPVLWFFPVVFSRGYMSPAFGFSIPTGIPSLENVSSGYIFLLFVLFALILPILLRSFGWRKGFLSSVLFLVMLVLFSTYKRPLLLIPVFLAPVLAWGLRERRTAVLSGFVFLGLLVSFFLISPRLEAFPVPPDVPVEGRVLCLPVGKCFGDGLFVAEAVFPMKGKEVITGWFPQSQSARKLEYLKKLSEPFNVSQTEYYSLLRSGWINAVVVRKNSGYESYFLGTIFRKVYEDENFIVFSPKKMFDYVEGGDFKVKRDKSRIVLLGFCEGGRVVVKESYHPLWKAEINGLKTKIDESEHGFMELYVERGPCKIVLSFNR